MPGGAFRENLLHEPGQKNVPHDHAAFQFKYDNLKKEKKQGVYLDKNGDVHIDRRNDALVQPITAVKSIVATAVTEVKQVVAN